jgi:hypothetical protein
MTDTSPDTAHVEVLPVPEGSIIWMHNAGFAPDMTDEILETFHKAIGHERYCILCTEGRGVVEVLGPDDFVARVRAALDADA